MHLPTLILSLLLLPACQPSGPGGPSAEASMPFFTPKKDALPDLPSLPLTMDTLMETPHFQFVAHGNLDAGTIQDLAKCSETAAGEIRRFTGFRGPLPVLTHHLYASSEQKGLLLKNTEHSHADFRQNEVHTVLDDCFKNNFIGKENELLLRHMLGQPKTDALEHGLAIYFTHHWQRNGYGFWAAKLAISGNLLPLAELLHQDNWDGGASLQSGCFAASVVAFLIEKWGRETFLARYAGWQPDTAEITGLEAGWQQFMAEKVHFFAHTFEQGRTGKPAATVPLPYLKGFNFAHEGYQIHNGYGSQQASQALEVMKNWGVNAVAIVPYSFIRNPKQPGRIPVVRRAGTETDESVVHSAEAAKKLGMTVVLKPQIWIGGSQWTGDIEMQSEEDWQAFFRHYSRWIVHYAMLAEIYGWDALCIGTELVQTTLQREEDWRQLIQQIRGVYTGPLTYAANWGDEFEQTSLWNDLDFIGLNCYYPLSQNDNPSDRELRKGFGSVLKKIEKLASRFQKPLIFTEIGFPSVEAPWKRPHEDRNGTQANLEHQRRCYKIIAEGIAGQAWCGGILWWKFPSHLESRRRSSTDFTPYGKPAGQVVRQWFSGKKMVGGPNH